VLPSRNSSVERVPGQIWAVLIHAGLAALLLFARSGSAAPPEAYRIGPGDVRKITVYGHEDLTRPAVVAADGRMPFPLIGEIQVSGSTPTDLEARLRQLLGNDHLVGVSGSLRPTWCS
jgi:protein involved in polysaccharide export with SLBB domain